MRIARLEQPFLFRRPQAPIAARSWRRFSHQRYRVHYEPQTPFPYGGREQVRQQREFQPNAAGGFPFVAAFVSILSDQFRRKRRQAIAPKVLPESLCTANFS